MKKILFVALISCFLFSIEAQAEKRCFGAEEVNETVSNGGRFVHCKKGDIISVYTVTLKESLPKKTSLNDIKSFSMREDEVSSLCSFQEAIVNIGQTEVVATALVGLELPTIINWFDCVYRGSERDTLFAK